MCYVAAGCDCVGGDVGVECVDDVCVGCVVDRVYAAGGDVAGVGVAGVVDGVDGDADVDVGGVDVDLCGGGEVVGCACVVGVVAVVVGVGCDVVCFVCAGC